MDDTIGQSHADLLVGFGRSRSQRSADAGPEALARSRCPERALNRWLVNVGSGWVELGHGVEDLRTGVGGRDGADEHVVGQAFG
jgi:hypothetical protein